MKNKIAWMSGACLCLALSACVDDNYDLSDVDTTVKVPVNNLTVPVNIEPVQLKNILDIDDDSPVKEINGQYAISETGHFESSQIEVDDIVLDVPHLDDSKTIINLGGSSSSPRAASFPTEIRYNIASEQRDLIFKSDFESTYITAVSKVGCDLSLTMNIYIYDLEGIVSKIDYKNVSLQLPKGLLNVTVDNIPAAEYVFETGVLTIPAYQSEGHNLQLKIHTSGIDVGFLEGNSEAEFEAATDTKKGHISLSGEFYMLDGEAVILSNYINAGNITSIPAQTEMTVKYEFSAVTINTFSGYVQYTIDNVDIPRVELSNMPDVLAQETTDLGLQNPQIYLTITNPLKQYNLNARTGLKIIAKREGKADREFTLDREIELKSADTPDGVFRFCLSPENPAVKLEGFESAEHIMYSNLGQIIAGEGVPDALEIELIKPRVDNQKVNDFALGVSVGTVTGDYELMAPLGITNDSRIIYTDDIDGWESEDLNRCTIEAMNINLTVSSDIPVDTQLTGYPINTSGQRIMGADGKPLSVEGAYIPANADNHKVAIRISGVIPANSNLNGLRFEATATVPDEDSAVLSPDMVITLTDIRPSITGYIIKDLDD